MSAATFRFDQKTHTYFEGDRIIPSVTQVLEGNRLIDLENVPGATLEAKRELGDSVHRACHYLDENDFDYSTMQPEWAPYIDAYLLFCEEVGFTPDPEWIEKSGVYTFNGMKFGYTIDRVGRISTIKQRVVLELKCAYKAEPSWKLQTAAYEMVVPKKPGEFISRVAVQLKPDGSYRAHIYENPRDKDAWLWALALTTWRIENGMKFRKE
jgi:hypothetical protein